MMKTRGKEQAAGVRGFRCKMAKQSSTQNILQIAGAFIAWIIGSGFATGQEVLQFFSSYGYQSYAVVAINLIGFIWISFLLMRAGYEHREDESFHHFRYFCGSKVGTFYNWLSTGILLLILPVLLSGAGATLQEYYGIYKPLGTALMAVLILAAYLTGFERLIKIVSSLGPVIIFFSLAVGFLTVARDFELFSEITQYESVLALKQTSPTWSISALLYLGLNFFPGSTFITHLGKAGNTMKEMRLGALLGAGFLILSIAIMNTAILLHAPVTAVLDIPVLYLAKSISKLLGAVFSVMLTIGIFSSSSVMMWSICSRFTKPGRRSNVLISSAVMLFAYVVSLFSFGKLIAVFYPLVGYIGLIFLACVLYKGLHRAFISGRK